MAISKEEIRGWIKRGQAEGATHMIVVCDTYDWEDYPVYVSSKENVRKQYEAHNGPNMQKVMEVYNLKGDIEKQLNMGRAFEFGDT